MSYSLGRINAAIVECLKRLDGKADPRDELQVYLEQRHDLSTEERKTVESMVFRTILDREQRRR